ncbi:MAG: hypothetical protein DMG62_20950 [Acidobacteria bacterium]|nr:MAG: hypothetical protein DMG62_20950 [Acidobacteriota bacterium]
MHPLAFIHDLLRKNNEWLNIGFTRNNRSSDQLNSEWALGIRHSAFGQCTVSMNHKTFTGRKPTADSLVSLHPITRSPDFSFVHFLRKWALGSRHSAFGQWAVSTEYQNVYRPKADSRTPTA